MPDYYGGDESNSSMAPDKSMDDSGEKDMGNTALINSDLCPGMKVGDTISLHIDKVLEGEYQVSYIPEKEEESSESEPAMSEPQGGSMSGMFE